jgi:hypothetical protein
LLIVIIFLTNLSVELLTTERLAGNLIQTQVKFNYSTERLGRNLIKKTQVKLNNSIERLAIKFNDKVQVKINYSTDIFEI